MKSRRRKLQPTGRVLIKPDEPFAMEFTVECTPVATTRRTVRPHNLRGRVVSYIKDDDGSHALMRQKIERAAQTAAGGRTVTGAIAVEITFLFSNPSLAEMDVTAMPHNQKPDLDNLEKAVLDAITRSKLWLDDKLVSHKNTMKRYVSDRPSGIAVYITRDTVEAAR